MYLNTNLLRAKMMEQGITCEQLGQRIGVSNSSMSRKINKRTEFSIGEMQDIAKELRLTNDEAVRIFLHQNSQKCE